MNNTVISSREESLKALRKILTPVNHQITIQLPEEFKENEKVEIIVMSTENEEKRTEKVKRKELFGKYKGEIWMSPDFNVPDPFDRLLYAQSVTEKMEFLYTDIVFDKYKELK